MWTVHFLLVTSEGASVGHGYVGGMSLTLPCGVSAGSGAGGGHLAGCEGGRGRGVSAGGAACGAWSLAPSKVLRL